MSNSINIKDWKTYKISNMFDVSYGKFIPRCDSESNGVPHITTTTMNNGVGFLLDALRLHLMATWGLHIIKKNLILHLI